MAFLLGALSSDCRLLGRVEASPKNSPLMDTVVRAIGRHFVTLSCMQRPPGSDRENPVVISGFVIESDGLWFYVTAGHVLRELETAIESGSTFDVWRLGDHFANKQFQNTGIPFDFSLDEWLVIREEGTGLDYAAVVVRDMFRFALEGGNVVPLGPETWGDETFECDHWLLVGVPSESVTHNGASLLAARLVAIPLERVDPPDAAEGRIQNRFFARMSEDSAPRVADIRGMSGGPIFSFRRIEEGFTYQVIGVQSSWYDRSRIVAACPFSRFGVALRDLIEMAKRKSCSPHLTTS